MTRDEIARMTATERSALLTEVAAMVESGELRLGEAARLLRSGVLGMDRVSFGRAVKVSARALANLEDDPEANPTLETLNRVFAPFGGRVALAFPGMVPAPPLDEAARQRREALRAALARNQRQPRRKAPAGR